MKLIAIILSVFLTSTVFSQEVYTLETCDTDIATDVPQFFHDYFQCVTARMSTVDDDGRQYINLYYNSKPPYETWYYELDGATESDHSNWISTCRSSMPLAHMNVAGIFMWACV